MISFNKKQRRVMEVGAPAEFARLSPTPLATEVGENVRRAAYPGYAPELVAALTTRASAETHAAAALPLAPEVSTADACLVDHLEELRTEASRARERRASARLAVEEAGRRLHALPQPFGLWTLILIHLVAILGTDTVISAVAALLQPSADAFLIRAYVVSTLGVEDGMFAATAAFWSALAWATALLGTQLIAVLLTRGVLPRPIKAAFVISDVTFAAGFAIMRLADAFSPQAAAVSIFEFAVSGAGTLMLLAIARALSRNVEREEPYRLALQESAFAGEVERRAIEALDEAESRLSDQVEALRGREDAVRRDERLCELAKAMVGAEYAVAASSLIEERAQASAPSVLPRTTEHSDGFAKRLVRRVLS